MVNAMSNETKTAFLSVFLVNEKGNLCCPGCNFLHNFRMAADSVTLVKQAKSYVQGARFMHNK